MNETSKLKPVTKKLTAKKGSKKGSGKKKKAQKKLLLSPWIFIGIIAAMGLGIFIAWLVEGRDFSSGSPLPKGYSSFCIDISHHNGEIQWDSLKIMVNQRGRTTRNLQKAVSILPVSRVIIKATEGEVLGDDLFQKNWEEAGRIDISRGAYHFFRSSKDARKQAENYINCVKLRKTDLPPVLDVETIHKGCTDKVLNDKILSWLEIVEKHYGVKPIVYTSDSFLREHLSTDITDNYPLWIARYNTIPPKKDGWSMWQFTDRASVYGIKGHVDLSVIKP